MKQQILLKALWVERKMPKEMEQEMEIELDRI